MFRFGSFFLISLYSLMLKILGQIYEQVMIMNSSKSSLAENLEPESSVLLQSGLVSKNCKCQVISGESLSGFLEEPKTVRFVVEELFIDQTLASEKNDVFEQNLEDDRESDTSSFYFKLLDGSFSANISEETRESSAEMEKTSEQEKEEEDEDDRDFSYEVELIPENYSDEPKQDEKSFKYEEDEYIEFVPRESISSSSSMSNAYQVEGQNWDLECDSEEDVLSEHQHLVEQMKMELKNSRIGGLPTISEESEISKMVEDLGPLQIHHRIGYKDVMQGINNFYKSYAEKMRKLDVLNYQTSHAISFLQLKESQEYSESKKKSDLSTLILPILWPLKARKIHADPIHKSMNEMHRDLELVYVGQMCLSWEILVWMDVRARELLEHDSEGHSYNRVAEEFQQFQVLLQRFMEDEQFEGRSGENYVRRRCLLRGLLQVPMIKDDCAKTKKERREETDVITLEMLVEMIKESMMIFHEFVLVDKKTMDVGLLSKVDLQKYGSSELLLDVVSDLQKKERRIKEQIRSRNCIVKKLKKYVEGRGVCDMLTMQVELRLVWRVLNMSRLSKDRLVWCQKKLNNISFVGRKVEREASFLLFPC